MAVLLDPDTTELIFQFEGNNQLSCSIKLQNTTENHVAFKVQSKKPERFAVQPWIGLLSPGGCCVVTVKRQVPSRAPTNMQTQSRDAFKIQSVFARPGTTREDARNLFHTVAAHMITERRLGVVYPVPNAQVASLQNSKKSSERTSEVLNPVAENQHNDLQLVESRSIDEGSSFQVVHDFVRGWNIHIGALILWCFVCTFVVVVSCCLMKQAFSLIWTLTKSMVMLLMKLITKLVSELIEDWVAETLIGVFLTLVCKYKDWLLVMLCVRVWDRVMDLTNWRTNFIRSANILKERMKNFNLLDFS